MKIEVMIDKEKFCEFDITDQMLLKVMYKFVEHFETNGDFIGRMSKK